MAIETSPRTTDAGPATATSNAIDAQRAARCPTSRQLYERAVRVVPSGVTHDHRYFGALEPVYIDKANGSRKWDVDGNEYIDYWMGHGALLLGHGHPAIVEAVQDQITRGTHYGASHPLEVEWAELIQRLVPSAERIKFTPGLQPLTMRWTNRPTFQQLLEFTGHRARAAQRRPTGRRRGPGPRFTG